MKNGYFYIGLSAFIFSTMEIVGKMLADINPFELNVLRFFIGGIILLPLALKQMKEKQIKFQMNDLWYFIISGLLCVSISMSFFQLAIVYTKASTVAIVFSTNPVFTIPFAFLLLEEKINRKTIISMLMCLIGILFILNPFNMGADLKGIIYSIVAAVSFSLYSVVGKKRSKKYGSYVFNCLTFLIGDIFLLAFMFICKIKMDFNFTTFDLINIGYLGIVVTGLGYLFYFKAIEKTSATRASIVFFIKPAIAPVLALIMLHESIPLNTITGIVCILLGSFVMLSTKKNSIMENGENKAVND